MSNPMVDVHEGGAVCLGNNVVCDGYANGYKYRVQTHIHADHMNGFSKSKGLQKFILSPETFDLLVVERNADLEYRDNFHTVERGEYKILNDESKLRLLPSNHMLGSCQVELTLADGRRLGYSGDFGWPLDEVIEVDELVIDSTYGSPRSVRKYSQEEAESRFLDIVCTRLRHGSIHIKAHPGTIERTLQVLGGCVDAPVIASTALINHVKIHQQYGMAPMPLIDLDSKDGKHAISQRSYIRLYSRGDRLKNELTEGTTIQCSAFMVRGEEPFFSYSDRAHAVALSNHADFNETIAYIKETGATKVVTDNTRNNGCVLAEAIKEHCDNVIVSTSSNRSVHD